MSSFSFNPVTKKMELDFDPRVERMRTNFEGIPISQLPFNPRMPGKLFPFPKKPKSKESGGFKNFGNLREAIRRLQEKRGGDMGMPRMPGMGSPGGTPGFYDRVFKTVNPRKPGMDDRLKLPQPIPERMPTDPSSYYNPTIFGQQMGDMDFSQMPEISPVDMSNLQMPTLPREISQMDLPQMPEG